MAYVQIAQGSSSFSRKDGSTRTWQFTFFKQDGTSQSYNIPLMREVEIKHGNHSDKINKPIKVSEASFTLRGLNEPLITEVANAGLREIMVRIEETENNRIEFEGFVLPDEAEINIYDDLQELPVKCYGGLFDLQEHTITSGNVITLEDLADEIGTILELPRELDLFSDLRHLGQATTDPLPLNIRFDELDAVGQDEEGSALTMLQNVMTAFGWQCFQRNGRIVFADLYDRSQSPSAVPKWEGDGAGGYNDTTEDVELTTTKGDIRRVGKITQLVPVKKLEQRFGLHIRDSAVFTDPSPIQEPQDNETEREFDTGLVLPGDEVTLFIDGELQSIGDPPENKSGTIEFARLELQDFSGSVLYYYDPASGGSWVPSETHLSDPYSFTGGGGQQASGFSAGNLTTPPVPDDIDVAKVVLVTENYLTPSDGTVGDINGADFNTITLDITYADSEAKVTRIDTAGSDVVIGDTLAGYSPIGDIDEYNDKQAFQWDNSGSWEDTDQWVSPEGGGDLSRVVAERVGIVGVGEGVEFTLPMFDLTPVDLMTVGQVEDNGGNVVTCVPVEIRYRIFQGFYLVRFRVVRDGVTGMTTTYTQGIQEGPSSTTSSSSSSTGGGDGGGGVTDHGELEGLGDDDHTQYHNDTRGDARYYTKTQLNNGQLDDRYYTETEVNNLLGGKLDTDVPISSNTGDTGAVELSSGESLRILGGTDIATSITQGTGGVEVTINYNGSAGSDTFVNGGIFEYTAGGYSEPGTSPDWAQQIKVTRSSGVSTYIDMRPMATWADARYLQSLPSHNHDDRYYTETEVNNLLDDKLDAPINIYPNSSQTAGVTLQNGDEIRVLGGGDISASVSEGAGYVSVTLTYNEPAGAGDNNYVTNGIFVDGTSPNSYSPYIELNRLNIGDTYVDMGPMETWADGRYASSGHSHTASEIGAVPTSRTVTAGTGLSGGGALSSNITINMDYLMNQNVRTSDSPTFVDVTTTSDGRVKTIDKPLSGALEMLRQVQGYIGTKQEEPGLFYVAQELETVVPHIVQQKELNGFDDFRVVNVMGMQVVNTMAIKEVDDEVTVLKKKVRRLERKVKELRGSV